MVVLLLRSRKVSVIQHARLHTRMCMCMCIEKHMCMCMCMGTRAVALLQATSMGTDESGGSVERKAKYISHAQVSSSCVHATRPDVNGAYTEKQIHEWWWRFLDESKKIDEEEWRRDTVCARALWRRGGKGEHDYSRVAVYVWKECNYAVCGVWLCGLSMTLCLFWIINECVSISKVKSAHGNGTNGVLSNAVVWCIEKHSFWREDDKSVTQGKLLLGFSASFYSTLVLFPMSPCDYSQKITA